MAGRARGVRGAERGGQDDTRTWSRVLRNPAPDPRSVARLMPKPRVLQTHTGTPARAPGCGPCGVGLTSGVQAAETPPLLPEPHPGIPPPKTPELLPSVCRTEEPTVTCQPPPDVHTCAYRPGTHMPSTDKRNSSQINHTDSAHYENSARKYVHPQRRSRRYIHADIWTFTVATPTKLHTYTHAHTHTRPGWHLLRHPRAHTGTHWHTHSGERTRAQTCTCLHRHTTTHVAHTHTHHLQACAVCLIANTWAAVGSGLSQPFEAARPGGRPPSPSLQSGNEVRGLSRAGPIGQAGGKRGRVRGPWLGLAWLASRACLGRDVGAKLSLATPGS